MNPLVTRCANGLFLQTDMWVSIVERIPPTPTPAAKANARAGVGMVGGLGGGGGEGWMGMGKRGRLNGFLMGLR